MSFRQILILIGFVPCAVILFYYEVPWFFWVILMVSYIGGIIAFHQRPQSTSYNWKKQLIFMTLFHLGLIGWALLTLGVYWPIISCYLVMYLTHVYDILINKRPRLAHN